MTVKSAENQGYILNMYINSATDEFKQRLLEKMRKSHGNLTYILVDNLGEKECALMHKYKNMPNNKGIQTLSN